MTNFNETMNLDEMIMAIGESDTTEEMLSAALDCLAKLEEENKRLRDELIEEHWKTEDAEWKDAAIERLEKELAEARRGVLLETGKPLWWFERVGKKHLDK